MKEIKDGWYAKFEKVYRGDRAERPFRSPWEVFLYHKDALKAAFLKDRREVLLIESRHRRRLPGL